MQPALYDTIELLVDLPAHHLRSGGLGAVVHAYDERNDEVELINHVISFPPGVAKSLHHQYRSFSFSQKTPPVAPWPPVGRRCQSPQ
jgi:hypothetical protein